MLNSLEKGKFLFRNMTHFRSTDIYRLKIKNWKEIFHTNSSEKKKKGRVVIPINDKMDFKTKIVRQ